MTDEEKARHIASLVNERRGYEMRGLDDRVRAVNDQLRALGEKASTPAARATKRPAATRTAKETR